MKNTLVVVESPTKAKTISRFLGRGFTVMSSFGHVRDLPSSKMGIDTESGSFEPHYIIPKTKKEHVKELQAAAKKSDRIIFATDEDREGEAISWHLAHIFDIAPEQAERMVFHEITEKAIQQALSHPRPLDLRLVDAQQTRRIIDRLVGYELSPLLWKKIARGLSAGRVQSVAVRLIVEREREIEAFKSITYFSVHSEFVVQKDAIQTALSAIDATAVGKYDITTAEQATSIVTDIQGKDGVIQSVEIKNAKRTPPPPFITSTLQQISNQKLGYSAKQTMRLAQILYEGVELGAHGAIGLITYMRTDSTNLSENFLEEARAHIHEQYGKEYELPAARTYKTKDKAAQEAHEAIRPTDIARTPNMVEPYLDPQALKLYTLIWKRALATQMADAVLGKTTILIDIEGTSKKIYTCKATGQIVHFPGWLTLYPDALKEERLPELAEKTILKNAAVRQEEHATEPPARYSDATIVKALEEYGIGRPSTYAPTIATIEDRGYVERDEHKRLKPTGIAIIVNDLLVEHFPDIVNYQFTASLENDLDAIAEGNKEWKPVVQTFYTPFHAAIVEKTETLSRAELSHAKVLGIDPQTNTEISVKIGRYGPYVQRAAQKEDEKPQFAPIPKTISLDAVTLADALTYLSLPKIVGKDADGYDIKVAIGRFGPYVQVDKTYYSIKERDPYGIALDDALVVIEEGKKEKAAKTILAFPNSPIQILRGRFGPYITDGKKNAKIPKGKEPETLTLVECEALIAVAPEKKKRGRSFGKKKK